jgi:hypothetical protein
MPSIVPLIVRRASRSLRRESEWPRCLLQLPLFQSVARSGQESLAQGLPGFTLGNSPTRINLKGPSGVRIGSERLQRVACALSPFSFRAKRLFRLTLS